MSDEITTRLSRQLHDQVDGWQDAPLTLEGVRGRARSIRRRRQALTTGVVAAAVLAVAVPVGIGLGARTDSAPDVTNPGPTRIVDDAPTPRAAGTFPLTVEDLPEGGATTASHLVLPADELRFGDVVLDVPPGVVQIERFGDSGWLALQTGDFGAQTGTRLLRLDASFEVVERVDASSLVVDEAGQHAAWIEVDGQDRTLVQADPRDELVRTEVGTDAQLVGHLAGDRVVFQDPDYETGEDSFGVVGVDGEVTVVGGVVRLIAATEAGSQVSAMTKYGMREVCYAVLDPTSGTRAFDSCQHEPVAFSPDGSLVAAFAAGDDGLGSPQLAVLDAATGDVLVEWSTGRTDRSPALVQQVTWEDDDTVVATVTEGTAQTIVRGELDGTLERVAEPIEVQMSVAYRFAGAPWGLL